MRMTGEIGEQNPFEQAVLDAHIGNIEPRSHIADEIQQIALTAISNHSHRTKSADGERVYETEVLKQTFLGQDLELSLMMQRPRSETLDMWYRMFYSIRHNTWPPTPPITLAINRTFSQAAAIIVPRMDSRPSASVLVGNEANNPYYLTRVLEIVKLIAKVE